LIPPFDIFRVESDGRWVWQGVAETLDVARLHIKILMAGEPGNYVIHSPKTGHETIVKADRLTKRVSLKQL
jgi:hypothetical protein